MLTAFAADTSEVPLIGVDHTTQNPVVVQPGIVIMQALHLEFQNVI